MLPLVTAFVLVVNGVLHFLQYRDYFRANDNNSKFILVFAAMFLFFAFLIFGRGIDVIYYMATFFSLIAIFHQGQLAPLKTSNPLFKNLIIVASALSLVLLVFGLLLRFMAA